MQLTYAQLNNIISEMTDKEKRQPALVFLMGKAEYCTVEHVMLSDGTVDEEAGKFILAVSPNYKN